MAKKAKPADKKTVAVIGLGRFGEAVALRLVALGHEVIGIDSSIEIVQKLADDMQAGSDVETFLHLDREFHLLSYAGATTFTLGDTVHRLWNSTQHYRRAFTLLIGPDDNRAVHYEHQLLVGALLRGDGEDAERVLSGHIRRTRLELSKHPELFADAQPV